MPSVPKARPRLALTLDLLVLAALLIASAIYLSGGFSLELSGVRITAHQAGRTLLAACLIAVLRRFTAGRGLPLGIPRTQWEAIRSRWYPDGTRPVHAAAPRLRDFTWACLGLCAAGTILLWPQLRHMDSVPDLGDPLFSIWRIGWVFHSLHGDPRPLFSPNIFYPDPLTLTYSDSMLLPSLTAVPMLALGVHPVIAYNVLFVASFVMSGIAMFALATHLTGSRRGAFMAALLFGFYPYRIQHHSHLELQMTYWMPLALLAWHRYIGTARVRYAVAAGLCTAGLLYSSMYYGVFFLTYTVPVLWVWLRLARPGWKSFWLGAGAAALVAGALAVPLAKPYLAAQPAKGERPLDTVEFYSATPGDYGHAHWRSLLYGHYLKSEHPERELFPGVMPLALGAAAFLPPVGPAAIAYGAGLLYAFDGSLGTHGLTYPLLYRSSGIIRGMRVPARFGIIVGMTLALLAAFSVARLLSRLRTTTGQNVVFAVLVGLAGFDMAQRLPIEPVWREPPAVYAALTGVPNVVLAEFPVRTHIGHFTEGMPFLYFSLWHWSNMVNGASGFAPRWYDDFVTRIETFPDTGALAALIDHGVTHVTVNCALYDDADYCASLVKQAERFPQLHRIAQSSWQGATVQLYSLQR
ncbi:MAG: hypothetical protein ABI051_03245 [Vicinamibacterales bacterium]